MGVQFWRDARAPRRPAATRRLQQAEAAWQRQVIAAAELHGWAVWHDYDSRRNAAGWPDLLCARPPRLLAIELKSATGRVRPPQQQWLAVLAACGVECHVWRPSDWEEVLRVLRP